MVLIQIGGHHRSQHNLLRAHTKSCVMRAIACCAAALLLPASSAGLSTKLALWRVSETAQQAPVTTQLRREIALVQATRLRGGTTRPPKLSRSHEMYGPRASDALALKSAGWRQQAEPLAASNPLLEDGTSGPSKALFNSARNSEQGLVQQREHAFEPRRWSSDTTIK